MAKYNLICCVCGTYAGNYTQWHNRDKGFGICAKCAAREATRQSLVEFTSNYGHAGINFLTPPDPYWHETDTFKTGQSK